MGREKFLPIIFLKIKSKRLFRMKAVKLGKDVYYQIANLDDLKKLVEALERLKVPKVKAVIHCERNSNK